LKDDPKLPPELAQLSAASAASHLPYRICETNSFCGGGKLGVSDTFGAALWVLDFMFKPAAAGAAGVNMETGVNHVGFISFYSPIGDDERGAYNAAPEYLGMRAFVQASQGRLISAEYDPGAINLVAYAVENRSRQMTVTIVNRDATQGAEVVISAARPLIRANLSRLTAPSLQSKDGVSLSPPEQSKIQEGQCRVQLAAASAAIVVVEQAA